MARTFSNEEASLNPGERARLADLARTSIRKGLCGERLAVRPEEHGPGLCAVRASFVTIEVEERLRGCIGTLEAHRPLVVDVVENAYSAAYHDPRFPALTWPEFERLSLHISILSVPEPLAFESEEDLLRQLRPGVDGLILAEGHRHGTFLPAVWHALPDPREFLRHLKHKAGLPPEYWSASIRVARYTAESIR
ncbi:AMMECR1 domain-containing protein [Sulfurifustis variabilis]|uniref:AMMECR1 domain-containing protein n=1 Tax=Sulfurifustis variabilis TaxID=1675686 RepID=A0A1B4V7M4_9GAMM|nr:AmmeMemoRadiSam system protein A [Sulfurifustis variabilis]BAU49519.1 AMMECR1 domain-containing protein [Sulfurifustis variabilis]